MGHYERAPFTAIHSRSTLSGVHLISLATIIFRHHPPICVVGLPFLVQEN